MSLYFTTIEYHVFVEAAERIVELVDVTEILLLLVAAAIFAFVSHSDLYKLKIY